MQKRHTDRKMYFHDLEITSKEFYVSYLSTFKKLTSKSRVFFRKSAKMPHSCVATL